VDFLPNQWTELLKYPILVYMANSSRLSSRPVRNSNMGNNMGNIAISSYNNLQSRQRKFIDTLAALFGNGDGNRNYTRTQVLTAADKCGMSGAPVWVTNAADRRAGRGLYAVPETAAVNGTKSDPVTVIAPAAKPKPTVRAAAVADRAEPEAVAALVTEVERFVPEVDPNYVPWGNFSTIRSIVKSKVFFPMWITGLSGNGKTTMVEQVCAKEGREYFRVNITEETDEDDLLGGFRLVNGDTVWQDGPVVQAMNRGAVLLLDEIDLGSFKIMCLQPVLEGKGIFLKKVGRYVKPTKGFTVFATANTKGKGSDDGTFVGTRVQNEALLERFKGTIEQSYPPVATEIAILLREFASQGISNDVAKPLSENLAKWSDIIRDAANKGVGTEVVTTRRLVAIAQAFAIFGTIDAALKMALSRFDQTTRESWIDIYNKLVPEETQANAAAASKSADPNACPF
jgi:MoxR-like ATPase